MPLSIDSTISSIVTSMFATRINPDFAILSACPTDMLSIVSNVPSNPETLSRADFGSQGLISMYLPSPPSILSKGAITFPSDSRGFISDNEFTELI